MSSPSLRVSTTAHRHLGFNHSLYPSQNLLTSLSFPTSSFPKHPCNLAAQCQKKQGKAKEGGSIKVKGKPGNVWSMDNELAAQEKAKPTRRRGKSRVVKGKRSRDGGGRGVLISGAMLMEVETVLQTQVVTV